MEAGEINKVLQKIAALHRTTPMILDVNAISGDDTELREFTLAFYRIKNAADIKARYSGQK